MFAFLSLRRIFTYFLTCLLINFGNIAPACGAWSVNQRVG